MVSHQLSTYSQVLTAARRVEMIVEKRKKKNKYQTKSVQKPFNQVAKRPTRVIEAPPAKRPIQPDVPPPIFTYCNKVKHVKKVYRMANGLCLICGANNHQVAKYLSRI
jgi:hypothetical protein